MLTYKLLTSAAIAALSLPSTDGLLKGSIRKSDKTSIETQGRNLVQQTAGSCETDTTVKAIGQSDCGIELSSANEYDDSLVILNEDMICSTEDDTESAIIITASRITLDCKGHKLEDIGNGGGFGLVLLGDDIIVRNCEISSFGTGMFLESSGRFMLQNVNSNNNSGDGLKMDGGDAFVNFVNTVFNSLDPDSGDILSSLKILSSNFDNNGRAGMRLSEPTMLLSKLSLVNVTANSNNDSGFVLREVSMANFVDVEARNNADGGVIILPSQTNKKLTLHSSIFCRNGASFFGADILDLASIARDIHDFEFDGSFSFIHQAITCDNDGIGICDCQC